MNQSAEKKLKSIYPIKGFIPQSQMEKRSRVHQVQKSSVIWDPNDKTIIIHVVGWLSSLFVENPFGTSAFFPFWFSHWNDVHLTVQITEFSKFSIGIWFFFNRAAVGAIDESCWIFLVLEISFGISVYKWGIYANDACHHSLLRVHFYNLFRIKRHALFMLLPSSLFNRCCSGFPYFNSFWEHGFNVIIGRYVCSTFILCLKWSKRYPGLLLPLFVTVNHKQIQLSLEQQQSHYFFFFYL